MPLYEYECKSCGHVQEELHSIAATPKVKCEECETSSRKIVSLVRIHGTEASRTVGYNIGRAMSKAKDDRKEAGQKGHMGSDPYGDLERSGIPDVDVVDEL